MFPTRCNPVGFRSGRWRRRVWCLSVRCVRTIKSEATKTAWRPMRVLHVVGVDGDAVSGGAFSVGDATPGGNKVCMREGRAGLVTLTAQAQFSNHFAECAKCLLCASVPCPGIWGCAYYCCVDSSALGETRARQARHCLYRIYSN